MRIILVYISLLLSTSIYSQPDDNEHKYAGAMDDLYLNRQPSARIEAMGRASVANTTGDFGSYYNPALTGLVKGINFSSSFSGPYFEGNAKFNYFGITYSDEKLGSFSLSRYYLNAEEENYYYYSGYNTPNAFNSLYTLNYSREIVKDLFAGVNLGIAHMGFDVVEQHGLVSPNSSASTDPFTLDIGILKKFAIHTTDKDEFRHSLQIGASIYNLNKPLITNERTHYETYALPEIFRVGASYNIKAKDSDEMIFFDITESTTNIEYQNVLNSKRDVTYKIGEEIIISDYVILRAGFFYTKIGDYGYDDISFGTSKAQKDFTCGAGLKFPLGKMLKIKNPLTLVLDYAHLSSPRRNSYYKNGPSYDTFALNVSYLP